MLAERLATGFDKDAPRLERHDTEPATGFFRRAWIRFLSTLPIDWLL